jgi:hypothetical protein
MTLNCSAKPTFKSLQIMHSNNDFIDENYNADLLDAWSDLAYQQEQAMREEMQPPNQTNEVTNDSTTDSTI